MEFDAETLVWTAGVKANPVLQNSDLPLDKMGRVTCNAALQVVDAEGAVVPDAYAAGDCAAVPDLYNPGQFCPPNAQHALREGNHLGDNLARVLRSADVTEYKHKNIGAVASLGMYKGVAQMFGRIKVRGFLAWVLHRTYHVAAMPTWNRKIRIAAGWTGALLLRREVVALGSLHDPRAEFRAASVPAKPRAVEPGETTGRAALPPQKAEPGSPAAKKSGAKTRLTRRRREPSTPRGSGARVRAAGRMARSPRSPTGRGSRLKPGTVRVRTPAGARSSGSACRRTTASPSARARAGGRTRQGAIAPPSRGPARRDSGDVAVSRVPAPPRTPRSSRASRAWSRASPRRRRRAASSRRPTAAPA